jgi:hypothetical protein
VAGIDSTVLKGWVEEPQAAKKSDDMDTKIRRIDEYLENKRGLYNDHDVDAAAKGAKVKRVVKGTLDAVIRRIDLVRGQLQSMFPYWVNCCRKAKGYTIHRSERL